MKKQIKMFLIVAALALFGGVKAHAGPCEFRTHHFEYSGGNWWFITACNDGLGNWTYYPVLIAQNPAPAPIVAKEPEHAPVVA